MRIVGQPRWRLRDYLQGGRQRARRVQVLSQAARAVAQVAGAQHEFVFRHEVNTLADLQALLPAFQHGYNEQRLHRQLQYRTLAAVLAQEVTMLS